MNRIVTYQNTLKDAIKDRELDCYRPPTVKRRRRNAPSLELCTYFVKYRLGTRTI